MLYYAYGNSNFNHFLHCSALRGEMIKSVHSKAFMQRTVIYNLCQNALIEICIAANALWFKRMWKYVDQTFKTKLFNCFPLPDCLTSGTSLLNNDHNKCSKSFVKDYDYVAMVDVMLHLLEMIKKHLLRVLIFTPFIIFFSFKKMSSETLFCSSLPTNKICPMQWVPANWQKN